MIIIALTKLLLNSYLLLFMFLQLGLLQRQEALQRLLGRCQILGPFGPTCQRLNHSWNEKGKDLSQY